MRHDKWWVGVLCGAMSMSCASTRVTSAWKDPNADQANIHKILVVALVPQAATRRNLEEHLSAHLRQGGMEVIPSAKVFPETAELTKEAVRQAVETQGFDGVLVTTYLGTDTELNYVSGGYESYVGYYSPFYYSPGYVHETQNVKLETRLFDASEGSGKLIWSAATSTLDPSSADKAIPELADKIIGRLQKDVNLSPAASGAAPKAPAAEEPALR